MPTLWNIHMLGGLTTQRTGHELTRFHVRKTSSLLAYLAFHLNEDVSKEQLMDSLWPNTDVARARHSLSESLSILRRHLEPPDVEPRLVLQVDHSCVRINGNAVVTDLANLKLTIAKFSHSNDPAEQTTLLRRAVAIYSGELLPGFFDDWILAERDRLSIGYLQVFHRLINMLKAIGNSEEALEYALRATAISPNCEDLHEEALALLIELGRNADAIHHFDTYRKRLLRMEGQSPGSGLLRIMEPFEARLNRSAPGRKRGARKLQVPPAPAPVCEPQDPIQISRLPTQLTRFFGREEELTRIVSMFAPMGQDEFAAMAHLPARLVTVTGLGGSGKTRFATEAGRKIQGNAALGWNVAFVPLSGVTRAEDIPQSLADSLQLNASGGSQSVSAQIRAELCDKSWLLLLDNCEHLTGAGVVVRRLIEDLPDLRVLATSRMPLEVEGEQLFALQPLTVPQNVTTPSALYEFPSVQMFVNRAQAVNHDFQITDRNAETVCKIAQQLEGIPLAIELAAAHVLTLTPSQILSALADRFDLLTSRKAKGARHRALKDTLDWSFELLSEEAQRFFVSLSVFQGGFTSHAAIAVCEQPDTRGLLNDLAESSLIVPEPGREVMRFSMLESVREYAGERMESTDKESIMRRHAAYYLQLAKQSAPDLRTKARASALGVLDEAHRNLLAGLEYVNGDPDELNLVASLWQYWEMRGYIEPGLRLLERATQNGHMGQPAYPEALHGLGVFRDLLDDLDGADAALNRSLSISVGNDRGRVLNSLALLMDKRGEYRTARDFSIQALSHMRASGTDRDIASCLNTLGRQYRFEHNLETAESYFAEAQSIFESLEDWPSAGAAIHNIGCIESDLGNLSKARAAFERGLALFRDLNRPAWVAYALQGLGDILGRQGDLRTAHVMLLECLDIRSQLHDHSGVASAVEALATVAHNAGDTYRAVRLVGGSAALRARLKAPIPPCDLPAFERDVYTFSLALSEREYEAAWDFGSALSLDRLVTYAREQRLISGEQEWEPADLGLREMAVGRRSDGQFHHACLMPSRSSLLRRARLV